MGGIGQNMGRKIWWMGRIGQTFAGKVQPLGGIGQNMGRKVWRMGRIGQTFVGKFSR